MSPQKGWYYKIRHFTAARSRQMKSAEIAVESERSSANIRKLLCLYLWRSAVLGWHACLCWAARTRIQIGGRPWSWLGSLELNGAAAAPQRAPQSYRHSRLDKNPRVPGPVTQNWKHFTRRRARRHVSRIRSNKLRGIGNRRPAQNPIRGLLLSLSLSLSSPSRTVCSPRSHRDFLPVLCPRVCRAPRALSAWPWFRANQPLKHSAAPLHRNKSADTLLASNAETLAGFPAKWNVPLTDELQYRQWFTPGGFTPVDRVIRGIDDVDFDYVRLLEIGQLTNFLEVERLRDCATCKPFDCGSSFLVSMISIPTNRYPKRLDIWKQLSKLFKSPWLPPPFRHSIPLHHVSSRVMFQSSATAVCNTERIVNFQPIQPRYK